MHAAWSVLFFTVLSGAGLGALALVALADVAGAMQLFELPGNAQAWMLALLAALALVVTGLCSSVLHLANPRNAWRSATRFRTSWLSREAVFSLALLAAAAAYVLLRYAGAGAWLRVPLALIVVALAWTVLYCTAMIYASLKPIRAWHTRRVPVVFALLGHATGALLVLAVLAAAGVASPAFAALAMALFVLAALAKLEYWRYLAGDAGAVTLEQAVGVAQGVGPPGGSRMAARLLDVGHSRGTFLTREFVNVVAPGRRMLARAVFWVSAIALPLVWLGVGLPEWRGGAIAFVACIIGALAERWLFFKEARHTVRLYHGERRT